MVTKRFSPGIGTIKRDDRFLDLEARGVFKLGGRELDKDDPWYAGTEDPVTRD